MHAFDRQTDGRTDRNLIVRPRLHSMQRGKNLQQIYYSLINNIKLLKIYNALIRSYVLSSSSDKLNAIRHNKLQAGIGTFYLYHC